MKEKAIKKFWGSVEKTDYCWNWTGLLDQTGLPVIRIGNGKINGKVSIVEFRPRRLSIELDGKTILSSEHAQPLVCRNKLCVNPNHLIFGDEARFWLKVQKLGDDDCWIWTGKQDKGMYGQFKLFDGGKKIDIRAHRYSWQLFTGRPVPSGIFVCHKCDHPYCVNPAHLFLGTVQDNNKDKIDKGRQPKGESSGNSKLTEGKVKEIRELYAVGKTKTQLSRLYGVTRSAIYDVVNKITWKQVG